MVSLKIGDPVQIVGAKYGVSYDLQIDCFYVYYNIIATFVFIMILEVLFNSTSILYTIIVILYLIMIFDII